MAKGQKRSGREMKKPKASKAPELGGSGRFRRTEAAEAAAHEDDDDAEIAAPAARGRAASLAGISGSPLPCQRRGVCADVPDAGRPAPVLFIPQKQPARPMTTPLRVVSEFEPTGDQPAAIRELVAGVRAASATRCCSA